jgi:hypothetical protein
MHKICTLCKPCHMKFIWPSSIVCSIRSNPIQSSETCALRVPLLLNCQTMTALTGHYTKDHYYYGDCINGKSTKGQTARDSNPGPIFSIPGFGIETFLIPGSRDPAGITSRPLYLYYISVIDHNSHTNPGMVWYIHGTVKL